LAGWRLEHPSKCKISLSTMIRELQHNDLPSLDWRHEIDAKEIGEDVESSKGSKRERRAAGEDTT